MLPLLQRCHRCKARKYATANSSSGRGSGPLRKEVTVLGDDGRVRWSDLTRKEKAARTTQQSFNLFVVVAGALLTGTVLTVLFFDVFAPDSKTAYFNRAVDRIKKDARCVELLGPANKIKAYGEPTSSRWARNRPLASKTYRDPTGVQNLVMHFHVEGPRNKGVVRIHLIKGPGTDDFEYKYLALDIAGRPRLYLERRPASPPTTTATGKKDRDGFKMFGVRWS